MWWEDVSLFAYNCQIFLTTYHTAKEHIIKILQHNNRAYKCIAAEFLITGVAMQVEFACVQYLPMALRSDSDSLQSSQALCIYRIPVTSE